MVELYSIEVHFDDKESCIFFKNIKKKKQIYLNKQILKDSYSLREDIRFFIEEVKEKLNNVVIDEPTSKEKNDYWDNKGSMDIIKKVQKYENYRDVQKWITHLENALNRLIEDNVYKETGQAWSSYFSREIYDIPDKLKWIKRLNSFKGYVVIDIPSNFDELLECVEKYSGHVRYANEILEDECLKEYLVHKGNIVID